MSAELGESARWIFPVSKAVGVALRIATDHGNEGEGEQYEDQDDFAATEPEFCLTICTDCKAIDQARVNGSAFEFCGALGAGLLWVKQTIAARFFLARETSI